MTRWPLLLPPPAVLTSPSRSRRSSLSIFVKSPSRRSSPSSCRRAIHRRSAASSITVHSPSCCPSLPIAVVLSVHRRRARAVPRRRGAVAPSLTVVEEPSRRPSPSRSRRAIHCRRAPYLAIKEPLAVSTDDSGHSSRPSKPLVWLVVALPLLTPPPPICRHLLSLRPSPFVPLIRPAGCPVSSLLTPLPPICWRLRLSSRRRLLLSRPSRASRPAG